MEKVKTKVETEVETVWRRWRRWRLCVWRRCKNYSVQENGGDGIGKGEEYKKWNRWSRHSSYLAAKSEVFEI